jgi:hypothetical protein
MPHINLAVKPDTACQGKLIYPGNFETPFEGYLSGPSSFQSYPGNW